MWLYIPLNCVPESECSVKDCAPHAGFMDSTAEPFATWSGKPLLRANLRRLWKRERLIKRLSGLTFEPSMAQRGADAWIASLPGSLVKTSLSLASALVSTESALDSSSTLSTLPMIAVRGSSFWRMSQASLLPPPPLWTKPKASSTSGRPPESWENWPTAGGMRNGRIYERPTSALTTVENDGSASPGAWATMDCNTASYSNGKFGPNIREQASSWATPDANALERTNRSQSEGASIRPTLALAARAWATPRATDGTKGGPNQAGSKGDLMLPSMAAQWATPNVPNGGRSVSAEVVASRGKTDNGKRQVGLESEVKHWATPTAQDHKDGGTSLENVEVNGLLGRQVLTTPLRPVLSTIDGRELSPTARILPRRLNPAFACWLMGWPIWWTNPGITSSVKPETELWRSKLQLQLSSLLGAPASSNNA